MSPSRPPTQPPQLPDYTFERVLGSGGFADVYLYAQHLPQRQVAIKVLTHEATQTRSQEQFVAEANLMAQLSTHSAIVTIYHAGTADDGRPYLAMQYCPLPNLAERLRDRALSVPEALSIGVRLAGALETAHRAGIVHRDVKPANILTTEFGRPALTDFGIAGLTGVDADESGGVSVPWASPEAIDGEGAGALGDVYSLAATIYTLLAARSPFQQAGAPNTRLDYIMRIKRDSVPTLGRNDVPDSLQRLLMRAMAKSPADRPPSALELGHSFQVVEQELRLAMTDVEVPDSAWLSSEPPASPAAEQGPRTVVRAVSDPAPADEDRPSAVTAAGNRAGPNQQEDDPATVMRLAGGRNQDEGDLADTGRAQRESVAEPAEPTQPARLSWRWVLGAGIAAVMVVAVIVVAGVLRPEETAEPQATDPPLDTIEVPEQVPSPTGLQGERTSEEEVEFSWVAPTNLGEVTYSWQRADGDKTHEAEQVEESPLTISSSERVCIELKIVTEQGGVSAEPAHACVE